MLCMCVDSWGIKKLIMESRLSNKNLWKRVALHCRLVIVNGDSQTLIDHDKV